MTTETKVLFADVKVGDRVWANSGVNWVNGPDKLKTVVKTSPAFIYLDGSAEFNTFRRDGKAYGKWMRGSISRIATSDECKAWDAARAKEEEKAKEKQAAEKKREVLRAKLRELFSPDAETNMVYVEDATWTEQRREGKFDVTFHGLTETEVRKLAEKVKQ